MRSSLCARFGLLASIALNVYFIASFYYEGRQRVHIIARDQKLPPLIQTTQSLQDMPLSGKAQPELETTPSTNHEETTLPRNQTEIVELQGEPLLAVAVMSFPDNVDKRNAIRNTWKSGYKQRTHYVQFVIATRDLSSELVESLQKEQATHQDMLLLENIKDQYNQHPRMVLATLVWFDQNVNYTYLLKTDDNCFVTLDRLEAELEERNHTRGLYWGYFTGTSAPQRKGIYAEPYWVFCDKFFPYAYSGGYVLSANLIEQILSIADEMIIYNNEDVTVGAWTVIYDIERRHDVRFDTDQNGLNSCQNSYLVTGQQSIEEINGKHKFYRESQKLCESETSKKLYEYDWDKLPADAHVFKD